MSEEKPFRHVLIRDSTVLVRLPHTQDTDEKGAYADFFDVRTGVQLKEIHPAFKSLEAERGYDINDELAAAILKSGAAAWCGTDVDPSKVVTILEVKQRKLDTVVADSVLDQVRVIRDLLQKFLNVAQNAPPSEKFWLSQQLLTIVRKFSGRELEELEEMVDWMSRRPRR